MGRPYVEHLRIQNYGCIKDAAFELTRLHALIGPNDSGKSTILRALRTLSLQAGTTERQRRPEESRALRGLLSAEKKAEQIVLETNVVAGSAWRISSDLQGGLAESLLVGTKVDQRYALDWEGGTRFPLVREQSKGSLLLRLDPDAMRAPVSLIPEGEPLRFLDDRGTGLGALVDALITRDLEAYREVNARMTELFPTMKGLWLRNVTKGTKAIGIRLESGDYVAAEQMSEGMLYFLAYAVLPYLEPTSLILVEEPENGLHPARVAEVVRVLREVSKTTQVVLATHSPLVVNELSPDEVTVVTRHPSNGTKATRLRDTPNFEQRSKVYALGELWLSYANGIDEAPLLEKTAKP